MVISGRLIVHAPVTTPVRCRCRTRGDTKRNPTKPHQPNGASEVMWLLGLGLHHSAVEIYGREWCFGGHEFAFSGVFECEPRAAGTRPPPCFMRRWLWVARPVAIAAPTIWAPLLAASLRPVCDFARDEPRPRAWCRLRCRAVRLCQYIGKYQSCMISATLSLVSSVAFALCPSLAAGCFLCSQG